MLAPMPSISVCPPHRRGRVGMWPLTPLAKRRKIYLPRARNRSGKVHELTTWAPDPALYSWVEERRPNEKSAPDHDAISGCRRCPPQQRVGPHCPQTGGEALQAGVGRDGGAACPDLQK